MILAIILRYDRWIAGRPKYDFKIQFEAHGERCENLFIVPTFTFVRHSIDTRFADQHFDRTNDFVQSPLPGVSQRTSLIHAAYRDVETNVVQKHY